ncbi:MAG: hypothetical protein SFY66_28760, partial [Oculatellaceae cyanobacterium bins.114]|nr:hypothetical protein [Oculatellaceae cyanobacterium bins.114]
MAKRSLKASPLGIAKAKQAFQRREWTQEYLASAVDLQTRQPIWKFFSGRPIERHLFIDICFQLNLDWEDIADFPKIDDLELEAISNQPSQDQLSQDHASEENLDWIQQVRSHVNNSIQHQCSHTQNVLDLTSSLTLSQIYTDIYLLPHLS